MLKKVLGENTIISLVQNKRMVVIVAVRNYQLPKEIIDKETMHDLFEIVKVMLLLSKIVILVVVISFNFQVNIGLGSLVVLYRQETEHRCSVIDRMQEIVDSVNFIVVHQINSLLYGREATFNLKEVKVGLVVGNETSG